MKKVELKGKRITLRCPRISDAKELMKHINNKEINRFLSTPTPVSFKKEIKWIKDCKKNWSKGKEYNFVIVLYKNNQVIGSTSLLRINTEQKNSEIVTWITKEFWGKGINNEAKKLLLDFGFKKLKLHRICAKIITKNTMSVKAVQKFGFKKEGTERESFQKKGKYYNVHYYGLLKDEWLKRNKK
ncbi:MAG: GNAT family protein [archaeon]